jgi:uncharacterized protein YjgD (DUF1641 family)
MPWDLSEVKKMAKENTKDQTDQIQQIIGEIVGNDKSLVSVLEMIKSLSDSGSLKVIQRIMDEMIPGNPEAIIQTVDKLEFHEGGVNLASLMVAMMASLSGSVSRESINTVLYNSDELWSSMVDGAKKPENFSLFGLLGLFKDPEIAAGMTAVLNALKVLGKLLKRVNAGDEQ